MTAYIPSLTLPSVVFEQPAIAILLPILAGTAIGFTTRPVPQYRRLRQPPLQPPAWIFGPVWTVLYGLMGYASYRAWNTGMGSFNANKVMMAKEGATLYTMQLALNYGFMPLYFGFGRPIEATADVVALLGTTAYLTYVWGQIDQVAAWCLYPYLAWLSFATYLSAGSGYLNKWDFSNRNPPKISPNKDN